MSAQEPDGVVWRFLAILAGLLLLLLVFTESPPENGQVPDTAIVADR